MGIHYYTSSSLDGFIATPEHSLDWLFKQDFDQTGPMNYQNFLDSVGVLVMGSSTYEWLRRAEETWPYSIPTFVLSRRQLPMPGEGDIRPAWGRIEDLHGELLTAAGGKDIWVMGGGDVAGQFADANLLDEVWVQFAPVTLGEGQPLLPRTLDLELLEVVRNRAFVCTRHRVLKPPS